MKVKYVSFVLLIACCMSFFAGCGRLSGKDAAAYQIVCYIADEYNVQPKDIQIISGSLRTPEEDSSIACDYMGNLKVSIKSKIKYFAVSYTEGPMSIKYMDTTEWLKEIIDTIGNLYFETNSFDIAKVNKKLKNS